jgi:hypothetical protein
MGVFFCVVLRPLWQRWRVFSPKTTHPSGPAEGVSYSRIISDVTSAVGLHIRFAGGIFDYTSSRLRQHCLSTKNTLSYDSSVSGESVSHQKQGRLLRRRDHTNRQENVGINPLLTGRDHKGNI